MQYSKSKPESETLKWKKGFYNININKFELYKTYVGKYTNTQVYEGNIEYNNNQIILNGNYPAGKLKLISTIDSKVNIDVALPFEINPYSPLNINNNGITSFNDVLSYMSGNWVGTFLNCSYNLSYDFKCNLIFNEIGRSCVFNGDGILINNNRKDKTVVSITGYIEISNKGLINFQISNPPIIKIPIVFKINPNNLVVSGHSDAFQFIINKEHLHYQAKNNIKASDAEPLPSCYLPLNNFNSSDSNSIDPKHSSPTINEYANASQNNLNSPNTQLQNDFFASLSIPGIDSNELPPSLTLSKARSHNISTSSEKSQSSVRANSFPTSGIVNQFLKTTHEKNVSNSSTEPGLVKNKDDIAPSEEVIRRYKALLQGVTMESKISVKNREAFASCSPALSISDAQHVSALKDLDFTPEQFEALKSDCECDPLDEEKDLCIICFDKDINCVFVPCYHMTLCSSCASKLNDCPICRTEIKEVKIIYRS